jgi:short-subunit dehydrogenase
VNDASNEKRSRGGVPVSGFAAKYGPWAVVAGASAGLGAEFARQLAARGLNLVLLARRADALDELASTLRRDAGVEVVTAAVDLGDPAIGVKVRAAVGEREVGLLVYNAAFVTIGRFLDRPLDDQLRTIDVNCRGPLVLAHELGAAMARRRRGGIVLMSSLAASQGSALVAVYAATKAFNLVLAEGLWDELRERGVDVLACRAGATRTPAFEASQPVGGPAPMEVEPVVSDALGALGHSASVVPGWLNRATAFLLGRLMPRGLAVRTIGRATRKMYGGQN